MATILAEIWWWENSE